MKIYKLKKQGVLSMYLKKLYIKLLLNSLNIFRKSKIQKIKILYKKPKVYMEHYKLFTNDKIYLAAIGFNKLQKHKVKTMVDSAQIIKETYGKYFKFNDPICYGVFFNFYYAIYDYFEDINDTNFEYALDVAKKVYDNANEYQITKENVDDFLIKNILILKPFVNIKELVKNNNYIKAREILLKYENVKICAQHCDYNLPNIKVKGNDQYIYLILKELAQCF